jgi:hypothetical protein
MQHRPCRRRVEELSNTTIITNYCIHAHEQAVFEKLVGKLRLVCNPKVHYRVHKSPPLVRVLNDQHPFTPSQPISLITVLILSSQLRINVYYIVNWISS